MNQKFLIAVLLCAMSVQLLACGGSSDGKETTSALGSETVGETTAAPEVNPFPYPEEDHGGQEFHVLVPTEKKSEFVSETTGDLMDDTIYQRNMNAAEHFNINFTFQYEPGDWEVRTQYNNLITQAVLAGDSTYDLATGFIVCILPTLLSDVFVNLSECENLNFDNPWWIDRMKEDLTIGNGQIFCAIGDGCLSTYRDCGVCYFNKGLIDEYKLENPYDLVEKDEWTLDKFTEMASQISVDLNNDGQYTYTDDKLGYYSQNVPFRFWQTALEIRVFDLDKDNNRVLMPLSERMVSAVEAMQDIAAQDWFHFVFLHPGHSAMAATLAEDRALFFTSYIYVMEDELMRNMKSDFGIVPYPKFDKEQKDYHSQMGTSTNVMLIPKSAKDIELTCRVMEALSYFSYKDVVPTYYEMALADKYTRDETAVEMLHLIRQSMTMDFTSAYSSVFNPFPNALIGDLREGKSVSSYYEANKKAWEKQLKKLNEFQSGSVLD